MVYLLLSMLIAFAASGCASLRLADASATTGSTGAGTQDNNVATTGPGGGATMAPLPGEFALQGSSGSYLGDHNKGDGAADSVTMSGGEGTERFYLWYDGASGQHYAFQYELTQHLSTSPVIVDEALFKLLPQGGAHPLFPAFAIQTVRGYFVTAVGGGNPFLVGSDALHTDATRIGAWEDFRLSRCLNLGSGSKYMRADRSDRGMGERRGALSRVDWVQRGSENYSCSEDSRMRRQWTKYSSQALFA
jgi:hypothetical protein